MVLPDPGLLLLLPQRAPPLAPHRALRRRGRGVHRRAPRPALHLHVRVAARAGAALGPPLGRHGGRHCVDLVGDGGGDRGVVSVPAGARAAEAVRRRGGAAGGARGARDGGGARVAAGAADSAAGRGAAGRARAARRQGAEACRVFEPGADGGQAPDHALPAHAAAEFRPRGRECVVLFLEFVSHSDRVAPLLLHGDEGAEQRGVFRRRARAQVAVPAVWDRGVGV